jgi:hypothetical protein
MWIFSQKAFLSVVAHNTKPDILIVRSRFKGHIEKIFPNAHVLEDPNKDYRFRAELDIKEVARVIAEMVLTIRYDNFKASLDMYDERYMDCCLDVYHSVLRNAGDFSQLYSWQEELNES